MKPFYFGADPSKRPDLRVLIALSEYVYLIKAFANTTYLSNETEQPHILYFPQKKY